MKGRRGREERRKGGERETEKSTGRCEEDDEDRCSSPPRSSCDLFSFAVRRPVTEVGGESSIYSSVSLYMLTSIREVFKDHDVGSEIHLFSTVALGFATPFRSMKV